MDEAALEKERQLVEAAKAGSGEDFGEIYERYLDRIYRFVLLRVGDRQTAEDLTSVTFLKAWDNLDRYEQRQFSFSAWLFRIARNTVIDHYRTRKQHVALDQPEHTPADQVRHVAEQAEARVEAGLVLQAMGELTEAQQEVLYLKLIEDLSTKEVARLMGKRPGAIRALLMRALRALGEVLGTEDHE
jgi:RNA polymerase sigma-70 factor, ECF subfamily